MKKLLLVFILCILSCQSITTPEEPETVLEEELMINILTDIAFIRAAKTSSRKVFDEKGINPESYILRKYGVDSIVFAENNAWYGGQLERYKAMFTKVKSNIEVSKIKYEKLKKEEDSIKKVQDSIKKAKGDKKDDEKDKENEEELEIDDAKNRAIEEEMEKARVKRFNNLSGKE